MMRMLACLAAVPFATSFALGLAAQPAFADWAANHCNNNGPQSIGSWSRSDARNYAATAAGDGYDWGGGCWNANGVDDTPTQNGPQNSVGEGPDCSGLVFKSWAMALDWSANKRRWELMTNQHGPYTAAAFKAGNGAAKTINKLYSTTMHMDAFASSSHIGLIYYNGSGGNDTIIEAKDQGSGTGIWTRNYRADGNYGGVRRENWG